MPRDTGGSNPRELVSQAGVDKFAKYQLSDAERKLCTPQPKDADPYIHDLFELFPELDSLIAQVDPNDISQDSMRRLDYYRKNKGASGSVLDAVKNLLENIEKYRSLPEFITLKERHRRLNEAHSIGYKEEMGEAFRGAMEFEDGQARRRQKEKEQETILPRLGVKGTFQTPDGAIHGIIEPGAEVGGPYTIKGPQGRIRVSRITKAEYDKE